MEKQEITIKPVNMNSDISILRTHEEEGSYAEEITYIEEESSESEDDESDGSDFSTSTMKEINSLQNWFNENEQSMSQKEEEKQYSTKKLNVGTLIEINDDWFEENAAGISLGTDEEWKAMMEGTSKKTRNPLHQKLPEEETILSTIFN